MVKSDFNPETGVLDSRFEGKVYIKEIVDYIDATRLNKEYPRFLKILTDATKADMIFVPTDLNKIVEANNASLEQYDYIIDAIVIQSSKETAVYMSPPIIRVFL